MPKNLSLETLVSDQIDSIVNQLPDSDVDNLFAILDKTGISQFVRTNDDLNRIAIFYIRMKDSGLDPNHLFLGERQSFNLKWNTLPLFGNQEELKTLHHNWCEILTNYKKLDAVLSMMESLLSRGVKPNQMLNAFAEHHLATFSTAELQVLSQRIENIENQLVAAYRSQGAKVALDAFVNAMSSPLFAEKITSAETFQFYANIILTVIRLTPHDRVEKTITDMLASVRDNFDQDLLVLVDLLDRVSTKEYRENLVNLIQSTLIGDFLHNSSDLRRYAQFVTTVEGAGVTAIKLISEKEPLSSFCHSTKEGLFGEKNRNSSVHEKWKEILGCNSWDKVFTFIEKICRKGEVRDQIIDWNTLYHLTDIFELCEKLHGANIPEAFIAKEQFLFKEGYDFNKTGLNAFVTLSGKEALLKHLASTYKNHSDSVQLTGQYFEQALNPRDNSPEALKIKSMAEKELGAIIHHLGEAALKYQYPEWNAEGDFFIGSDMNQDLLTLSQIKSAIPSAAQIFKEYDAGRAKNFSDWHEMPPTN